MVPGAVLSIRWRWKEAGGALAMKGFYPFRAGLTHSWYRDCGLPGALEKQGLLLGGRKVEVGKVMPTGKVKGGVQLLGSLCSQRMHV